MKHVGKYMEDRSPKEYNLPGTWKHFQERQYRTLWVLGPIFKFQIKSTLDVSIFNEKLVIHLYVEPITKNIDIIAKGFEGGHVTLKEAIELELWIKRTCSEVGRGDERSCAAIRKGC